MPLSVYAKLFQKIFRDDIHQSADATGRAERERFRQTRVNAREYKEVFFSSESNQSLVIRELRAAVLDARHRRGQFKDEFEDGLSFFDRTSDKLARAAHRKDAVNATRTRPREVCFERAFHHSTAGVRQNRQCDENAFV